MEAIGRRPLVQGTPGKYQADETLNDLGYPAGLAGSFPCPLSAEKEKNWGSYLEKIEWAVARDFYDTMAAAVFVVHCLNLRRWAIVVAAATTTELCWC